MHTHAPTSAQEKAFTPAGQEELAHSSAVQTLAAKHPAGIDTSNLQAMANNSTAVRQGAVLQAMADKGVVQRNKTTYTAEKIAKKGGGGMLAGAATGAAIGSFVPGIGTAIGAVVGGGIGLLAGTVAGAKTDYPTFPNGQSAQYEEELATYREWKRQNADARNIYQSGDFVKYSGDRAAQFHQLLNLGQVMYTYNTSKELTISGHLGPIKHALLAEGGDVYAAGTAQLEGDGVNEYFEKVNLVDTYQTRLMQQLRVEEQALALLRHYGKTYADIEDMKKDEAVLKDHYDILNTYRSYKDVADHYRRELVGNAIDPDMPFNESIAKGDAGVSLTEDSGHYHPTYDSGHAAFEGWKGAGYNQVSWSPRWTAKKKHEVEVS